MVIVPDHDQPGEAYAHAVAPLAKEARAHSVSILHLPGLPAKGDVAEWLGGGTSEQFADLVVQADNWEPAPPQIPDMTMSSDHNTDKDCGLTKSLADRIQQDSCFAKDVGGLLYVFENGVYRPTGEAFVCRRLKEIMIASGDAKRWSTHRAAEVCEFIRVDAPTLWERPPTDTINVLNGLLDWKSNELRPHNPKHLSTVQIPVTHDPSATCPNWTALLRRSSLLTATYWPMKSSDG